MAYEALLAAALAMRPEITREAQFRFGVPAPVAVVAAQIAQESAFNAAATSRVGAQGLMQFMPKTASWAAHYVGTGSPLDARWALRAGVWYDRFLYERAPYPDDCQRWGYALASYNGGEGWQIKRRALADRPADFWHSVRLVNPGITAQNQQENQEYPYRIIYVHQPHFAPLGGRRTCL